MNRVKTATKTPNKFYWLFGYSTVWMNWYLLRALGKRLVTLSAYLADTIDGKDKMPPKERRRILKKMKTLNLWISFFVSSSQGIDFRFVGDKSGVPISEEEIIVFSDGLDILHDNSETLLGNLLSWNKQHTQNERREAEEAETMKRDGSKPPRSVAFLLWLVIRNPKDRQRLVGDLEEQHHDVAVEFGCRRANFFYGWWVGREVFDACKRSIKSLHASKVLCELLERLIRGS